MKSAPNPFDKRFLTYDEKGPREEQQDSCIQFSSAQHGTALVVVSDGVGGKSGGRLASQKVREMAASLWKQREGKFQDPRADLTALCSVSHQEINKVGRQHDMSPRATIVALYMNGTRAHWVHSGDSRLYHFRSGQFLERTQDHSVVQVLVKQGLAKESEMGEHPDQGTLLQSLGGEDYKEPSHGSADILPEDGFLLCTDGFWERTTPEEMGSLVASPAMDAPALLKMAVQRAIQRNGPKGDNVTAALALPVKPGIAPLPVVAAPMAAAPGGSGAMPAGASSDLSKFVLVGLAIVLCMVGGFLGMRYLQQEKEPKPDPNQQNQQGDQGTPTQIVNENPPADPGKKNHTKTPPDKGAPGPGNGGNRPNDQPGDATTKPPHGTSPGGQAPAPGGTDPGGVGAPNTPPTGTPLQNPDPHTGIQLEPKYPLPQDPNLKPPDPKKEIPNQIQIKKPDNPQQPGQNPHPNPAPAPVQPVPGPTPAPGPAPVPGQGGPATPMPIPAAPGGTKPDAGRRDNNGGGLNDANDGRVDDNSGNGNPAINAAPSMKKTSFRLHLEVIIRGSESAVVDVPGIPWD